MNVYLEDIDGDSNSYQRKQNQGQHCSVGVHHAMIFGASSTTSKESDNKHKGTNDDKNNRGVDVRITEKVQVLGHVDLNISTDANKGNTRQEKDEVEQKDNVLDNNFTTRHLG